MIVFMFLKLVYKTYFEKDKSNIFNKLTPNFILDIY